jgi:hypothetical protein
VEPLIFVLLTIATLGIYGVYRFYVSSKAYEHLAGRSSNFSALFWGCVSAFALAWITASFFLGFLLFPVGYVLGAMALGEAIDSRDMAAAKLGVRPEGMQSKATHVILWVGGNVFSWLGLGLVALIVQAVFFFSEFNRVAAAARAAPPSQSGW